MKYNKGFAPIAIFIIIIIVLAVGGIAYYVGNKSSNPSSSYLDQQNVNSSTSSSETSSPKNNNPLSIFTNNTGKPTKIPGTEAIFAGNGMSGGSGYQFTFSISPNGKYLLFLKGDGNGSPQYPQSTNLVLQDLVNNTTKEIPVANSYFTMGFTKDCWTADEKYCAQHTFAPDNFYDDAYVTTNPEFIFTPDNFRNATSNKYGNDVRNLCSDCQSKSIVDATVSKIINSKGESYLAIRDFAIGKSGKAYYSNPGTTHHEGIIYVLDPATMIEKQIFSTNAMSDVCLRQLAISPDETKIAFSRETQCGNVHTTPEVHIFDIIKNKDENLGNINISGVSQFSLCTRASPVSLRK
jgi:hypothetical protein